ncbi:hypothetical protein FACS1894147_11430 [Spirochaetia bacterium]|nr:hypothetical protein FACS1894147_11430 [Spirochaetia bacterium]
MPPGKNAPNMRGQEALSLAAAAAESKGLGLGAEALQEYAAAIDPEGGGDTDADAGGSSGGRQGNAEDHRREHPRKEDLEALREAAEKAEGALPLLGVLNRLPGKDGSRWIVLPFTLDRDGRIIKVSVRALLTGDTAPFKVERLGIDVVVESSAVTAAGKRRWLFFLDHGGQSGSHAELRVDPPLSPPLMKNLQKELAEALGPLAKSVQVSGGSLENSGFAADCRDETLLSIDRAV